MVNYPELARGILQDRFKEEGRPQDDVYVVWFCYILGGWKALLSTPVEDGRYYEITHNDKKNQTYIDTYVKESNILIEGDNNKEQ